MANTFKALDRLGIIATLKRYAASIRQFFATKSEMDVVSTALTDLDKRINDTIKLIKKGDLYHHNDAPYIHADGANGVDFCKVGLVFQMRPKTNFSFADPICVPCPSPKALTSGADCIFMPYAVTLNDESGKKMRDYTWSKLHWYLQYSDENIIVYSTRFSTNDSDFDSVYDSSNNIYSKLSTIEITIRYEKGSINGAYYGQVSIENEYGRAYYNGSTIGHTSNYTM